MMEPQFQLNAIVTSNRVEGMYRISEIRHTRSHYEYLLMPFPNWQVAELDFFWANENTLTNWNDDSDSE